MKLNGAEEALVNCAIKSIHEGRMNMCGDRYSGCNHTLNGCDERTIFR